MLHNPAGLRRRIGIVSVFAAVATTAACGGDSYERYGNAVHADVDAAMTEAFQITARLQLTVVHNRIPDDSLPVAARIVTRAARLVRKRAVHFAGVNPPPDFSEAHAGLSAALSRVADALEAMGSAFQRCAEAPCQAQVDSLSGRRYMSITYNDTTFESLVAPIRRSPACSWNGRATRCAFASTRRRTRWSPWWTSRCIRRPSGASGRSRGASACRRGTLPVVATSVAFLEQLVRRARVVGGDSVSLPVMLVGAQASLDVFTMIRNGTDSVVLVGPDGNLASGLHLAVDEQGHILGGVIPISGTRILSIEGADSR